MRTNRLARFCEWLRDTPILAGLYGCSTGSPARIPETEPIGSGSGAGRGCGAHSPAWISTGPATMNLELCDDERGRIAFAA